MTDTCAECRYFTAGLSSGAVGLCQRFPRCERVAPNYWCGEWQGRPVPALTEQVDIDEMRQRFPADDVCDDRTGM